MALKFGSSFSCVFTSLSSTFQPKTTSKVSSRAPSIYFQQFDPEQMGFGKVKSCRVLHEKLIINESFLKRPCIVFATLEDQEVYSELKSDVSEQESHHPPAEDVSSSNVLYAYDEGAGGKPGLISFYGHLYREKDKVLAPIPAKSQNNVLWFVGPAVLVASFIFPSLYLRRILSTIFEDSLLTDFLILFFTEALFYCGVAVFLFLIDRLRRPIEPVSSESGRNDTLLLGHRISSVAVLVLSLIIPMVTMGFVWPWTGPAASATLAPYLVGIVVQFAFEQYARYCKSPSRPVIPIVFQVYRLHQLNRAAQLVTALSFTVRGAELTPQNLAINGSLSTILNVLQVLGVICIWSLSSFIMRLLPSALMPE